MTYFFAWYNLIFFIPLFGGVLLVLGSATGLMGGADADLETDLDGDADLEADLEAEVELDVEADIDSAIDFDFDSDLESDVESEVESEQDGQSAGSGAEGHLTTLLSLLGVGRVPLSILMTAAALIFGGTGFLANIWLRALGLEPRLFAWISLALALVCLVLLTGKVAGLVARILPTTETYRITKHDLIGRLGTLTLPANETTGLLQIYDHEGNLHQAACRTRTGALPKGSEVLVLKYQSREHKFIVAESPLVGDGPIDGF